jgi:hypothetical protein
MKSRLIMILVITVVVSATLVWTYRPKNKYAFGGSWVGRDMSGGLQSIFYYHVSPQDVVGKREFSFYMNHLNLDAALDGLFPDAVTYADGVGCGFATGKDTFTYNSVINAVDARGSIVYYMRGSGTGRWVSEDEQVFDRFTVMIFLPSQDVDPYDGIIDEEQLPIMCVEFPLQIQRVPYFPPCTPMPM